MGASDYNASIGGAIGRTQVSDDVITDSTFVSNADVESWLDEHAADVDGFIGSVLDQSVGNLSDAAKSQWKRYIETRAAVDILTKLGAGGTQRATDLEERADAIWARFEGAPERIDGNRTTVVLTTTPTTSRTINRTPKTFIGDNYDGF